MDKCAGSASLARARGSHAEERNMESVGALLSIEAVVPMMSISWMRLVQSLYRHNDRIDKGALK